MRWKLAVLGGLLASHVLAQSPRIDAIDPPQGPIAGGTVIRVTGANLAGAAVTLDRVSIAPLSQSDSEVRLQMPKHDNGYALVQIGAAAAEFLYVPPRLEDLPPGYITTVAGVGRYLRVELPATRSPVSPWGLDVAPNGDIYFVQAIPGLVFRVSSDGILHHVAGALGPVNFEFLGDGGPAIEAVIGFPRNVARDAAGNLYVNDSARFRVRKIAAVTGIITTIAGTGKPAFSGDGGPAAQADLLEPTHLTCTSDGTVYFLDNNVRVRRITPEGIITTVVGKGTVGETGDGGPAIDAQLNIGPGDFGQIAVDARRNLFILENYGERVRRVDAQTGIITTFASRDSRPKSFLQPAALAVDSAGNVYVGSLFFLDKYDPSGRLIDSWGAGVGVSDDGTPAKQALLESAAAMVIAPNGDIVYSARPPRVRKINLVTGKLETIAGLGEKTIGVPGPAAGALFTSPSGDLAVLPSGDLIFADGEAGWMYRINRGSGMITPFGGGIGGGYVETPALGSNLGAAALDVDGNGNVIVTDKASIRSIDTGGIIHRITRGGPLPEPQCGFTGDGGPARDAVLCQPEDASLDRAGNIFIADTNNNRVRRIDAQSGIITTVAGSGPSNGFEGYGHGSFCGDGGPATSACLNSPVAVAVRDDGTMYVNDFYNGGRIRKITPDGTISSLPGWPQTLKLIVGPGQSIFGHGLTRIYRADKDRIRVLAGGNAEGFGGDGGPASAAVMASGQGELAEGLAIDAEGNLFFHDAGNRRIRAIRFGAVLASPTATIDASGGTPQTVTQNAPLAVPLEVTVRETGAEPAPGVRVDFRSPASGPSCLFDGAATRSATTDSDGKARVLCIANSQIGSYLVSATPIGTSAAAGFALTNTVRDLRLPPRRTKPPAAVDPRRNP